MNACRAHYYRMTALKKAIIRVRYVTGWLGRSREWISSWNVSAGFLQYFMSHLKKDKKGFFLTTENTVLHSKMSCQCLYLSIWVPCLRYLVSENTSLCRYLSQVLTLKSCTLLIEAERHKHCEPNSKLSLQHNGNIFLSIHSNVFVSVGPKYCCLRHFKAKHII